MAASSVDQDDRDAGDAVPFASSQQQRPQHGGSEAIYIRRRQTNSDQYFLRSRTCAIDLYFPARASSNPFHVRDRPRPFHHNTCGQRGRAAEVSFVLAPPPPPRMRRCGGKSVRRCQVACHGQVAVSHCTALNIHES